MAQNRSNIETEQLKKRMEVLLQTPELAQKLVEDLEDEWEVGPKLLVKLQEIVEASPTLSMSIHNDELVDIMNKALYLSADKISYQLKHKGTAYIADYFVKNPTWFVRFFAYVWIGFYEVKVVRVRH